VTYCDNELSTFSFDDFAVFIVSR